LKHKTTKNSAEANYTYGIPKKSRHIILVEAGSLSDAHEELKTEDHSFHFVIFES
jgi:hypothetical protein